MNRSSRRWTSLLAVSVLGAAGLVAGTGPGAVAAPLNDCVQTDNGDPFLESFSTSERDIDVRAGDKLVTFSAGADDTGTRDPQTDVEDPETVSGVSHIELVIIPPGAGQTQFVRLSPDGSFFEGSFRVRRGAAEGDWNIESLTIYDRAGNRTDVAGADLPPEENFFHVTSTPDTTPPTVSNFSLSPTKVDTTKRPKKVTFQVNATDAGSGVASVAVWVEGRAFRAPLHHVLGSTYRGALRIPRWVGSRRWLVGYLTVIDWQSNETELTGAQLAARGFRTAFRVQSGTESRRPRITDFSLTPTAVDVRSRDVDVRIRVKARDNLSGVSRVRLQLHDDVVGSATEIELRRVRGTAKEGIWGGTIRFRKCVGSATGLRPQLLISDQAGNFRRYQRMRPGWSTGLTIKRSDWSAPFASVTDGSPAAAGPVELQFNELVEGLDEHTVAIAPLVNFVPGTPVPGSWACQGEQGESVDCVLGDVRTASFTPSQPLSPGIYQVELNPDHYLGLTDQGGNAPRQFVTANFDIS
jgi:hypothetical protein